MAPAGASAKNTMLGRYPERAIPITRPAPIGGPRPPAAPSRPPPGPLRWRRPPAPGLEGPMEPRASSPRHETRTTGWCLRRARTAGVGRRATGALPVPAGEPSAPAGAARGEGPARSEPLAQCAAARPCSSCRLALIRRCGGTRRQAARERPGRETATRRPPSSARSNRPSRAKCPSSASSPSVSGPRSPWAPPRPAQCGGSARPARGWNSRCQSSTGPAPREATSSPQTD